MIGTNKQQVKEFVEESIADYKKSPGFSVIDILPESRQNFINAYLYNLYSKFKVKSSESTLQLLIEVLNEYSGFSDYFNEQENKS